MATFGHIPLVGDTTAMHHHQPQQLQPPVASGSGAVRSASSRRRPATDARAFLSRSRFAKKCLADSLRLSSLSSASALSLSMLSSSSASSPASPTSASASASACYVPVPVNATAAAELEHALLLASSRSNASSSDDAALLARARAARRQVESVAKRHALVGRWKRRVMRNSTTHNRSDSTSCSPQVHECVSNTKDEFSVVAKLDVPCSLHELQSALGTESPHHLHDQDRNTAAFHRSMAMLFGDQYVYGVRVRRVDCAAYRRSSALASTRQSRGRAFSASTSALSATASMSSWSRYSHPLPETLASEHRRTGSTASTTSQLTVNAVSLLMRRRLVWRQRHLSFLDFSDERPDTKTVTRVLLTLDNDDDNENDNDDNDTVELSASSSRHRQRPSALQRHESRRRAPKLRGLLAGYVLQEDAAGKFTRLFFYGTHNASPSSRVVATASVQLLRGLVRQLCALEAVVRRRRLGFYPLVPTPTDVTATALLQPASARCSTCDASFRTLFRPRRFCQLCGHFACRQCSSREPVEKVLGLVDRRWVCAGCVRRVNYCVFDMHAGDAFYSEQLQAVVRKPTSGDGAKHQRLDVLEEECPPLLGDSMDDDDDDLAATEIEDLALFPDESVEQLRDVAADKVAKYIKGVFERNTGRQ